jgi:hypothetical protein
MGLQTWEPAHGCGSDEEVRQMIWVILGFDKRTDDLLEEHHLPADFTVDSAAGIVGDHPELIGASFPLSPEQMDQVEGLCGFRLAPECCLYFLEAQAS